jgi:hypothetical protein
MSSNGVEEDILELYGSEEDELDEELEELDIDIELDERRLEELIEYEDELCLICCTKHYKRPWICFQLNDFCNCYEYFSTHT